MEEESKNICIVIIITVNLVLVCGQRCIPIFKKNFFWCVFSSLDRQEGECGEGGNS